MIDWESDVWQTCFVDHSSNTIPGYIKRELIEQYNLLRRSKEECCYVKEDMKQHSSFLRNEHNKLKQSVIEIVSDDKQQSSFVNGALCLLYTEIYKLEQIIAHIELGYSSYSSFDDIDLVFKETDLDKLKFDSDDSDVEDVNSDDEEIS